MRIVGGKYGGRALLVPKSDAIRPTQDCVREALFNILAGTVPNCAFLDLFAGSGAVGLEALSRGAASATFVERDRRHADVLRRNIAALGPDVAARATVVMADAYRWISGTGPVFSGSVPTFSGSVPTFAGSVPTSKAGTGPVFDVVFADPPYALGEERGYGPVLESLRARGTVREGGIFVAEMTAAQPAADAPGWELLRDRTYGKTRLVLWRRI